MSKRKLFLVLFVAVLAGFVGGIWFGRGGQLACKICAPETIDLSRFWEAYYKLKDMFVSPDKLNDNQNLIYGAISGMVKSLDDPYTVFMPPDDAKKFIEDVSGQFEGVGMEIDIRNDQLQVVSPIEGTPASKAGLRPGDKILKINGTSTADLTLDKAVSLIRGPKGTKVVLTMMRADWKTSRDIELTREVIAVPSLKWEIKDNDIAYLRLYQFTEKASGDFSKAASEILKSPAKRIVLDLRGNPGGYLEVAQNIAGWFLKDNQIVAIEDFGKGEQKEYRSSANGKLLNYPLVVLMDQGSASASEILAGAVRDNRGTQLIGEKSFGKGSVQQVEKLSDGSSLKITVAKWLTPNGELIAGKGLEPDIKIGMNETDYEQGKDPQLDKALEVVKEIK